MRTTLVSAALAAVMAALTAAVPAAADTVIVEQSGKKFSQTEITVKKGDTVRFVNKDPYTHNVYSQSRGNAFDVKVQKPGGSSDVVLSTPGDVDVRCAIHPSMKLTIHVTE